MLQNYTRKRSSLEIHFLGTCSDITPCFLDSSPAQGISLQCFNQELL